MKKLTLPLTLALTAALLTSCMGTPVVYNCDCPTDGVVETPPSEGALKTGLALVTSVSDSTSASDKDGEGKYDVTTVAVLVDDKGVIRDCIIDGIAASVKFDASGALTSDFASEIKTKNELGSAYGMVAYGGAVAEWDAQAGALADFAVGKTVKELKNGAIDKSGRAPEGSDLASQATIYLGGYVSAIEKAVANSSYLGAQEGDELRLASQSSISGSSSATAEKAGNAQLEVTTTALTLKSGKITSCTLDSVQAKVAFDVSGKVTSDLSSEVKTKNELGSSYGMVAWGGAIAEWDAQAAAFAEYCVGKTPAEVGKIAVTESTSPAEADLASSVTIAIGGFQALIQKAAK